MRIETVNHSNITHAFPCLEQFSNKDVEIDIDRSVRWMMRSMHNGFRGKIAYDGAAPVGNIFYGPLKYSISTIDSKVDAIHLRCLYVKMNKRDIGIGHALVAAMKSDVGNYAGIVVSATETPTYMYYKDFENFGFELVKKREGIHYMYLPLRSQSIKLKLIEPKYKPSVVKPEITLFIDEFCPFWNLVSERIRSIAESFGDAVLLKEITLNQHRSRQYGMTATCLIDGENAFPGDVKDETITQKIEEAITKRTALLSKGIDPSTMPSQH